MALDLDHANHSGIDFTAVGSELRATVTGGGAMLEAVAGGAGFVNDSGAVDLDLTSARVFYRTLTGNVTEFTFSNVPSTDAYGASWRVVLRVDASGPYTFATTTPVTFVDGSSWDDLDLTANAENELVFWKSGTTTKASFVDSGSLALDPYVIPFPAAGTVLIVVDRAETIDLENVRNVEADGTDGTGTLSYRKNDVAISPIVSTAFTAGQVLTVTLSGSTTASAVSIPRYVP